ncbi:hypothetical protein Ldro_2928 [Legionella drozanskii LLAP-1]|uniref:Uncharacterized protein n=2 Tax=Legionella drozanskii TaxID=96228 RepID=A0A0W0SNC6_9GAMM|nr:hypothetical protein [Legionella drozanskii]KTC84764.1 hypothetical protein Ldro_2928 [Legionella drozanskii LLAP-1]
MKKYYIVAPKSNLYPLRDGISGSVKRSYENLLDKKQDFVFYEDKEDAEQVRKYGEIIFKILVLDEDKFESSKEGPKTKEVKLRHAPNKIISFKNKTYEATFAPQNMIAMSVEGSYKPWHEAIQINMPNPKRVPEKYCGFFRKNSNFHEYFTQAPKKEAKIAASQAIDAAISLFDDYAKKSWFNRSTDNASITDWLISWFHYGRNHAELARRVSLDLSNKEGDAGAALTYLIEQRQTLAEKGANMSGSMICRLDFAISNLAQVPFDNEETLDSEGSYYQPN